MRPALLIVPALILAACAPGPDRTQTARAPYPELLPLSELLPPTTTLDANATAAALEAEAAALRASAAALAAGGG
ncbi:hypothetical protein [Defluviimonas sp. WL0075]|uniref:Uncharacterized protein n=1 Tax=Albidovulum sediminicola TaxID=2984331 RepID=A0ABT2Z0L8_9RHOB|nr:hypothetical protein [Defluviimonas sp. WL0075]MCV2864562.1 hypothetical protein [Defluviimonas sp. WL0075]